MKKGTILLILGSVLVVGTASLLLLKGSGNKPTEQQNSPVTTNTSTQPTPMPTPPAAPTPTPSPNTAPTTTGQYTLADVAKHADATSCWSTINGGVYDLTSWISQHPGGEGNILMICGKDGTDAFNGQHSSARQPQNVLVSFKIGTLTPAK